MNNIRTVLTHAFVTAVLATLAIESATAQQVRRISPRDSKFEIDGTSLKVPMEMSVGHVIVDVMLGDSGPFRFVVDSAAGASLLDASLTKLLSLQVIGEARVGDASSENPGSAPLVLIPELKMGGATARDVLAVSKDLDELFGNEPGHPDGILGFPLFAALLMTFDYDAKVLLLEKGDLPPVDGKTILDMQCAPIPKIKCKLGDKELDVVIDTGAAVRMVLPKAEQSNTATMRPPRKTRITRRMQSEMQTESARLRDNVKLGGYSLKQPIVNFEGSAALLGSELLQGFRLTFDQTNGRVRFERKSTAPIESEALYEAGLATEWTEEGRRVRAVVPDSPAATAGLQADDLIVAANGQAMSKLDRERWRLMMQSSGTLRLNVLRGGTKVELEIKSIAVVE